MEDIFDRGAKDAIKKYMDMPLRTEDIQFCMAQLGKEMPDVLELGSSVGRGAEALKGAVGSYIGIDYSSVFTEYARKRFPDLAFKQEDIRTMSISHDIDLILAFGTLLFLSPEELKELFGKLDARLRPGGIIFADFKEGEGHETKKDAFGEFSFYRYTIADIQKMLGKEYLIFHEKHQFFRDTQWFSVGFQKLDN